MSFTTKTVTVSAYTAIENFEGGVGIYLNKGKVFLVIDVPSRLIMLNASRMPVLGWRTVHQILEDFATRSMTEEVENQIDELEEAVAYNDYKALGFPLDMYEEYYYNKRNSEYSGKRPKITLAPATEIDRYCVENLGATYEVKKVVRGKNLVFDNLLSATAVEV